MPRFAFLALLIWSALLAGCSAPSFLVTPVSSSYSLNEQTVRDGKGFSPNKVAIVEVEGMLINARKGGLLSAGENDLSLFTQALEKAEQDNSVKAVVLRVNSPGGTVTTSDTMYEMVKRFKLRTHKPVVASVQEVAASGAYYVSCAADQIVAQPTSVVGSIGVIFEGFDFSDTLNFIGVHTRTIHTGTLKEMGSPFKHPTPLEQSVMQEMVNEYFIRFSGVVKSNRPVKEAPPTPPATQPTEYAGLYSGRVWSGQQGKDMGLVDRLGLLVDAIDLAKELAKEPDAKVVIYKRPYGYSGSIYAQTDAPQPQANLIQLSLPGAQAVLPDGFYYLWQP